MDLGLSVDMRICLAKITYCTTILSFIISPKICLSTHHKNCSLGETDFIIVNNN